MAHKRLSSGRGSLVSRVVKLEKLGASTKKTIPSSMKESLEALEDEQIEQIEETEVTEETH